MAHAHPVDSAPAPANAAEMFHKPLKEQLESFAQLIRPHLPRLDAAFRRKLKSAKRGRAYDARQLKALSQITFGAAAGLLFAGRPLADFIEQVAYHSRRLAKLNLSPTEVLAALREYDRQLDALLAGIPRRAAALGPVREHLHFCCVLTVNNAFYQVREAETQAFFGLLRAEMDANSLDDLLRRFIVILTRTFHARSGRLIPLGEPPGIAARTLKRLARPRYIRAGSPAETLILDPAMRAVHQSYWSIPFFSGGRLAGILQFGFAIPYRWLPRELDLLNAFAERTLRAAERTRLIRDLAAREEQVRAFAGHLLQAEEEERRRIGREIHDEAGQSLLFLRLNLEMLEKRAPPALQAKLADTRRVAERIISEIRRIIAALNPLVVEQLGLPSAVRHLSARFRRLYPIKLRVRLSACRGRLPREAETTIYRAVQECYQNIARHSAASRVNLSLRSTDKSLELHIEDDGVGFDVDSAVGQPGSFGLRGMRERVALLGGRLEIRSRSGHGARISVRLPLLAAGPGSGKRRDDGQDSHSANG